MNSAGAKLLTILFTISIVQVALVVVVLGVLIGRRIALAALSRRTATHEDQALRGASAWVAGDVGFAETVELLNRLDHRALDSALRRISSAMSGGRWERLASAVRATDYFEKTKRLAKSRFWWRRLHCVRSLQLLATDEDLDTVRDLVGDEHTTVRVAAFSILGRVCTEELVEIILTDAFEAGPALQDYAFNELSAHPRLLAKSLSRAASRSFAPPALVATLRLMARLGAPEFLGAILGRVSHPDGLVRAGAAAALGKYPHPSTIRALARMVSDPEWRVRAAAARSLGSIRANETCEILASRLDDDHASVRMRAAVSLRQLGTEGLKTLREQLKPSGSPRSRLAQYVLRLDPQAIDDYAAGAV